MGYQMSELKEILRKDFTLGELKQALLRGVPRHDVNAMFNKPLHGMYDPLIVFIAVSQVLKEANYEAIC